VTALDLAILLGSSGFDVAMPHPGLADGQPESEGELGAPIRLDLLNRKW
jgi:hypothetical protein